MARYKRRSVEDSPERQIVLGMIVSDRFLKEVQSLFRPDLIETRWALKAMTWCVDYHRKFGHAPGVHIEDIYREEIERGNLDEDEEKLIGTLLESVSDEYDRSVEFNAEYLLDRAETYFETRNLQQKTASVKSLLAKGDVQGARAEWSGYKSISRPESSGVDPFTDRDSMVHAFEHSQEPLFKLPGRAGQFLNDLFVRDAFVTLLGPEKRGKTWMLIELSIWARRAGRNVAFLSAGDMTLPQMEVRYGTRFAGRSPRPRYCGEILVPVLDCRNNQDDSCTNPNRAGTFGVMNPDTNEPLSFEDCPDHVPCVHCRNNPGEEPGYMGASWLKVRPPVSPLDGHAAAVAGKRLAKRWGKKSRMKLVAFPNKTLSVGGIERQLDRWEDEDGFVPDVVLIDYMDLLIPDHQHQGEQTRHWISDIWGGTRRVSQERHCLVVSASQSDTLSYDARWITEKHFSESKTKNAHVTGMITLNQTKSEKRRKVMRLGKLLTREEEFDDSKGVVILQSLEQGKPILSSY